MILFFGMTARHASGYSRLMENGVTPLTVVPKVKISE